jgi:hypothetical protein
VKPALALLVAALALSGCGTVAALRGSPEPPAASAPAPELEPAHAPRPAAPRPPERPATTPIQLVARAGTLAREGRVLAARDLYRQVIDGPPGDPARPRALWELARLQGDPASPVRDYRAGVAGFDRLLLEYPRSEWEGDARAWRTLLAELIAREDDNARLRAQSAEEIARLRAQLQRLKKIDVELERRPGK